MTAAASAIVAYPPSQAPILRHEQVNVRTKIKNDELLIQMCATSICHTDLVLAGVPPGVDGIAYPRILGHEGAGHVQAIGDGVTIAEVGDPVILSYNYCGHCDLCTTGWPSYCIEFTRINSFGSEGDIFTDKHGTIPISGSFFGQSSFSSLSIVKEACVVNVKGLTDKREDLQCFAPLGCGILTGSGAILEAGRAQPGDVVVIFGLGGVGLAAVMAAKLVGCKAIIAVDRIKSRVEIAEDLGATHILNTDGLTESEIVPAIQILVQNERISLAIDTTGVAFISAAAITCLGMRGRFIAIGVPADPTSNLTVSMADFFGKRKILERNIMGSAQARELIPKLIKWCKEGRFPVDRLVTLFDAKNVQNALLGMENGSVIKPVLLW